MKIIIRDNYKIKSDVLIAEVYDKDVGSKIIKLLNSDTKRYYYQLVSNEFEIEM